MLFKYKAITRNGSSQKGEVESANVDSAIKSLQERDLIVSSIDPVKENWFSNITFFESVSGKDMVFFSRQAATLFEAQVSALRIFQLLSEEMENKMFKEILEEVARDIQGGSSISDALAKHPEAFSEFYVNMVSSGEEIGNLEKTFTYLADYLERTYEVNSKVKNALIYPAFIVFVFIAILIFLFTVIIPQIAGIIEEAGAEIPIYTKIILAISDSMLQYGLIFLMAAVVLIIAFFRWIKTKGGKDVLDKVLIKVPFIKDVLIKLYLSRIADNMNTMISSGISIVRSLEISANVVGNNVYENILNEAAAMVKEGKSVSEAFANYEEIPKIMTQMTLVGEESGSLGQILETQARFYRKSAEGAIDTALSLIEPALIITLGLMVAFLAVSVITPIYTITTQVAV